MATKTSPLRELSVLLVDDQPAVRHGLRLLFQMEFEALTICEAGTGTEAMHMAASVHPDLVIMDVVLPDRDGISATKQIISLYPNCRVIVLTIHGRPDVCFRALAAGACAFVEKQRPDDLRTALRQALSSLRHS